MEHAKLELRKLELLQKKKELLNEVDRSWQLNRGDSQDFGRDHDPKKKTEYCRELMEIEQSLAELES